MKRILFLFVVSLMTHYSAVAETILPFVQDGKVWSYKASHSGVDPEYYKEWEETYCLEGDTVIGSHQCLRLYLTCNSPYKSYDHAYIGAMYEKGGKVYYIAPDNTTSAILYDFSRDVGDIVKMDMYDIYNTRIVKWDEYELKINDKQLVKYRDEYLTVMNWSPLYDDEVADFCTIWIEGVGSPIDLLNSTPEWGSTSKKLLACKLNNQIIYDKNEFMEYYPAPEQRCFTTGTKWTEIRLDTMKYDNWYSQVGDDWVANYETVEYSVKLQSFGFEGKYCDYVYVYNVYTNGPEWSDSLSFQLYEFHTEDDICIKALSHFSLAQAYQFNWFVGKELYYQNIVPYISSAEYPYGTIEEIKEGDFGGIRPLKYIDLNGVRIIQGIGVTEWNDGECLYGPVNLYRYSSSQGTPPERHYRSMLVHFERNDEVLYDVWPEAPHQPQPFLEGNPIWVFKYEHMPMPQDPDLKCWLNTGDLYYSYYFLGEQKEIEGKVYTMMGEVECDRDGKITLNRWLPVREENGIVYAFTDSLPGFTENDYDCRYNIDEYNPMPYLQQGNECVLYSFSTDTGETLYPQNEGSTVKSFDTFQLLDGTECRVLKTTWGYYDLYEKLGFLNTGQFFGIMDPLLSRPLPTNGHVYVNTLNAYYQGNTMLYKAPDPQEGLCVNDTCWTREDAAVYAPKYKANPYHEEVMSYIRQLQMATEPVTFTKGQMATIILPITPDASKGKYYRLDRVEDNEIIFEQELQPQARTPYIIVPNEDFSIDLSTMDLEGLSQETVSIEGVSFVGSYRREEFECPEGFYIDIIDKTPDCLDDQSTPERFTIGALRAYLAVNWSDPIYPGGSRSPKDKMGIVLHDKGTGIDAIQNGEMVNGKCFDLSGRQITKRKLPHGIYIEDGKKKVK